MRTYHPPIDFSVIVGFPLTPGGVISGRTVELWLHGVEGEPQITSAGGLSIYMTAEGVVWGEVEMWADEDGKPIFTGTPAFKNHQVITKVFTVRIAGVRSRESYNQGHRDGTLAINEAPPGHRAWKRVKA